MNKRVFIGMASAVVLPILLGSQTASALPGGPFGSSSAPALVLQNNLYMGAGYGTWQGIREDQGRGTRMQDQTYHRSPAGNFGQNGAYVNHRWYFNGNNCYINSFSTTGGGVACSSGWWGDGESHTASTNSTAWQYAETWKGLNPSGSSGRGSMIMCENYPLSPDVCGGSSILRGNDY